MLWEARPFKVGVQNQEEAPAPTCSSGKLTAACPSPEEEPAGGPGDIGHDWFCGALFALRDLGHRYAQSGAGF